MTLRGNWPKALREAILPSSGPGGYQSPIVPSAEHPRSLSLALSARPWSFVMIRRRSMAVVEHLPHPLPW
jgi:hypothetical protein